MIIRIFLFIMFLLSPAVLSAQEMEKNITVDEAISIAMEQSIDAMFAKNNYLISYWQFRNFKAELLPSVFLDGTIPSLNRALYPHQLEDGSYKFVRTSTIQENLSLSINQNIPLTGGQVSVQSQLQRIDQLGDNKYTSYLSVPLSVTFSQPLITYNSLKWAKKIEPEHYEKAQKQYLIDVENIKIKTINYYFDLLVASVNVDISNQNLKNATTLHEIAIGKKKLGLISDNDLYQLELNMLNASSAIIVAKQNYQKKLLAFSNYIRYKDFYKLKPVIPHKCYNTSISFEQAYDIAKRNNPLSNSVKIQLIEAQRDISQAKASRGFKADLYVSLGFTGSNTKLVDSYKILSNRQIVSLGIRIPILDWGKSKGNIKIAESQYNIVKETVEQNQIDFEQNLFQYINEYHDQNKLLEIAQHADSIAGLRYETSIKTFIMGQINVLDINSAQIERDNAKRQLINEMYSSWIYYYRIRQLTLFDFENNTDINLK